MLSTLITNNMHDFSSSVIGNKQSDKNERPGQKAKRKGENGKTGSENGLTQLPAPTKALICRTRESEWIGGPPTSSETRPSAEGPVGPQVSVHHTSPNKFQKQVQRILEFVVHPCCADGRVHRSRQRRVNVGINQESNPKHECLRITPREWNGEAHPRSSRKRQITLATTSSFFSRGPVFLILVRAASFSVAVAPKHKAKSIVEDYYPKPRSAP